MKKSLKRIAIQLRREGYSYSEIIKKVPVAKSTLSLWLRSVNLTNSQKQKLTLKKLKSAKRGAEKRRLERIMKTREIIEKSILDIKNISKEELFLIGVVLYW
jgi:transposase